MHSTRNIVVAYDGSDSARRALDRAVTLTGYGSILTVVGVAESRGELPATQSALADAARRLLHQRVFAETCDRIGDVVVELLAVVGQRDADLLIVGHGENIRERLLGSVSAALVHRAPCDVLVAR